MESVDSSWDITDDWVFPDVYYDRKEQQIVKFPIDKAWIYDGNIAKISSATKGTYLDMCKFRQVPIDVASGIQTDYKINNQTIKANGCWCYMYHVLNNPSDPKITISCVAQDAIELRINRIQVRVATGSPNLTQLEDYVKKLGWALEMFNNNSNSFVSFKPISDDSIRTRLYIRMAKNPDATRVSDCLNIILV